MTTPQHDDEIYKDILLESLEQAIEEGDLEEDILPALRAFNEVTGVVTVQSCSGHPERDIYFAFIDMHICEYLWDWIQDSIGFILEDDPVAAIQLHYDTTAEGIQRVLRVRSHGGTWGEAAVPGFLSIAKKLKRAF